MAAYRRAQVRRDRGNLLGMINFGDLGVPRRDEYRSGSGRQRGIHVTANVAIPGSGLRQLQPASGACGQTCQVSNGPSSDSTRALTSVSSSGLIKPRATPDWLLTTPTATPCRRSRLRVRRAPGMGWTRRGSAR